MSLRYSSVHIVGRVAFDSFYHNLNSAAEAHVSECFYVV